jgi:hypothetical protein
MPQAALAEFVLEPSNADANGVSAKVTCGAKGKSWALVTFDETSPPLLPPFITQSPEVLGPRLDQGLPDRVGFPAERIEGQNMFKVGAVCAPLTIQPTPWAVEYELRRKLTFDPERAGWLSDWSAADAYRAPERAFGLRELAVRVLQRSVMTDAPFGRIRLEIKRIQ